MNPLRDAKWLMFIALMAALGNAMFVISQTIFHAANIALDLSHVGTFIAAIFGGPWVGLIAGFLGGIGPGIYFGYMGGSLGLLGLVGLPVGKAMTGLTVGYLTKAFNPDGSKPSSWKTLLASLLGYVPESIFTAFYFEVLVTTLLPQVAVYLGPMNVFVASVLMKAWLEIAIISFLTSALVGNSGFSGFIRQHFAQSARLSIYRNASKTRTKND